MRRSKEIIVLFTLLIGAMGFVLWYVIDRRAQNRANARPAATQSAEPVRPAGPNRP
jgi:zona occludens toxin (predicted ATPase)